MPALVRLMHTRALLVTMSLFQITWLALIRLTGIAANWHRITPVLLYTTAVCAVVICMPSGFDFRLQRVKLWLVQNEKLLLLALSVVTLIAGVIYANHQIAASDELRTYAIAKVLAQEGLASLPTVYAENGFLRSVHAPLAFLAYALAMRIMGTDLLVARLAGQVFVVGTVLVTYLLGRELYSRETGFVSALFLLSYPKFVRQGSMALTDIPAAFFFSLALLLVVRLRRRPAYGLAIAAGIVVLFGLLTKYTVALIFPFLLICLIVCRAFRPLKLHLGILFLLPALLAAIWLGNASRMGVVADQVETLSYFAQAVLRDDYGRNLLLETLLTRLPSGVGVYNLPLLILGVLYAIRRRSQSDLFVLLWIVTVFLLLSITLPEARYFLLAFPALAVVQAAGMKRIPKVADRALLLSLLLSAGALYLFVDWVRLGHLFDPRWR